MKKQIVLILIAIIVMSCLVISVFGTETREEKVSPCDAIDISFRNVHVIDFLDKPDWATVQVFYVEDYQWRKTWMVQWSSPGRLLKVYIDIATGNITGIEEKAQRYMI